MALKDGMRSIARYRARSRGRSGWSCLSCAQVWAFDARPKLRLVEVQGAIGIDPRQTGLPLDWHHLPTYRLHGGEGLRLKVIRRGDPEPIRMPCTLSASCGWTLTEGATRSPMPSPDACCAPGGWMPEEISSSGGCLWTDRTNSSPVCQAPSKSEWKSGGAPSTFLSTAVTPAVRARSAR
jgi:hypothetical protein